MKAEKVKVRIKENAEIIMRDRTGKLGLYLVGPGSVEVKMRKKRKRKAKKI